MLGAIRQSSAGGNLKPYFAVVVDGKAVELRRSAIACKVCIGTVYLQLHQMALVCC